MFKNVTPSQIAFWASALITALVMLMIWAIRKIYQIDINTFILFNVLIIFSLLCYFIIFSFIDTFIYRKVKLIYKTIHSYKSKPEQRRIDVSDDIFEDVENEVMRWVVA
jgi:two-component system, OmpR family, phosphate regulon sensor histidine kinase PhoR